MTLSRKMISAPRSMLPSGNDKDQRIFLRADKQVDYGALMELMNKLRGAGYLKVALVGLEGDENR